MSRFPNQTVSAKPAMFLDLQNIHDIAQAGAGSGRQFTGDFGGSTSNSYYPPSYGFDNRLSPLTQDILGIGVVTLFVIGACWVVYGIYGLISRALHSDGKNGTAGARRKRSTLSSGESSIEDLLGVSRAAESWRNGHPNLMRMLTNGGDQEQVDMSARITEAIEEKTEEFESN